jgi:PAS domain S-box-containing protein
MKPRRDDDEVLHKVTPQNARSILQAGQAAERELCAANDELARRTESLVRSLALVQATLEATADAILVTDVYGAITQFNEQLPELLGLSRDEVDTLDLDAFLQRTAGLTAAPDAYLARAREITAVDAESSDVLALADGRMLERVTRPQTVDGATVGRVWSFREVTDGLRTQDEMALGRARFAAIVDQSPVGIVLVDDDLRILHVNPAALPALPAGTAVDGAALADILRAQWPADVAAELERRFRHALATGAPHVDHGFTAVRGDRGTREHYDWQLHRITLPGGRFGVACYFLDRTQQVETSEAARESEELVHATFDQASVAIGIAELSGRFVRVNRKFTQLLGYDEEELRQRTFVEITHPDDREQTRTNARRLVSGAITEYTHEKRYVRKDGTVMWSLATVSLLRDAEGRAQRMVGAIEDITLRKRAEDAVREGAQRLQLALSAGALGDWSWDAASDVVTLGQRAAAIFGLPSERTVTWTELRQLLHVDDRERARLAVEAAIRERADYDIEYRVDRPGGERRWVAAKGRGLYTDDGHNVGMIGVVQDVTERRRLADLRGRLAAIVETSEDAVVSKDLDGTIRTWNRGAERIFGWAAGEIVGKSVYTLIPPDRADEERTILGKLRAGERIQQYETERLRKDGTRLHVSLSVAPVVDSSGRIVGASKIARDITDWKRAESALRRT